MSTCASGYRGQNAAITTLATATVPINWRITAVNDLVAAIKRAVQDPNSQLAAEQLTATLQAAGSPGR